MISPGLIFVQKAVLLSLFSEGPIIGGNFAFQNGLSLTIKQLAITVHRLIIGRIFASEIWGAYFRKGLLLGGAYYQNLTV